MANVFTDVHLFKAKLHLYLDGNCFLIASTVSGYFLRQILLRVLADGSTSLLHNALHDPYSSWLAIVFDRL